MVGMLADGHIPCAACGRCCPPPADADDLITVRVPDPRNDRLWSVLKFTRCPECLARFEAWRPWATQNAANIAALCGGRGPGNAELAADRAESLAIAAEALGFEGTPGVEVLRCAGLTKHPADGPAFAMRFEDYAISRALRPGEGSSLNGGWGHITRAHVAELKRYRDDALAVSSGAAPTLPISAARHLIAAGADDDVISSGCYCCGTTEAAKPGVGVRAFEVWTPVSYGAKAFGRSVYRQSAAGRVVGLVCPACRPHTDQQSVSEELAESLLAARFGHGNTIVFEDGPALLFAGAIVRARRAGEPEPVGGEPWAHLPRDENGAVIPPALGTRFIPEISGTPDPVQLAVQQARRAGVAAEEIAARIAAEQPSIVAAPLPPEKPQAKPTKRPVTAVEIYRNNPRDPRLTRF